VCEKSTETYGLSHGSDMHILAVVDRYIAKNVDDTFITVIVTDVGNN